MRSSDFRSDLADWTHSGTGPVDRSHHRANRNRSTARWSARTGTSGRSGTNVNTGNWNGSGTVPVSNLWCEHGLRLTFIVEQTLSGPFDIEYIFQLL